MSDPTLEKLIAALLVMMLFVLFHIGRKLDEIADLLRDRHDK